MLNIPESIKTLFKSDSVFKNFRVHFPNGEHSDLTNENIISESVSFTESICSKDVFQFGLSERSQIEFECVNMPNIYGVTIECGIEIDTSSLTASEIAEIQSGTYDGTLVLEADSDIGFGYYHVPYGTFIVESCPRSHGAMWRRKVTAYSANAGVVHPLTGFLNSPVPFNKLSFSREALLALTSNNMNGLTQDTLIADSTDSRGAYYFYDSTGAEHIVRVTGINYKYVLFGYGSSIYDEDFGIFDFETDTEAMDAVGVAIAQAVQAIKPNLIYNKAKTQIYATTEDALRRKMGELFRPTVSGSTVILNGSTNLRGSMDFGMELESGQMIAMPNSGSNAVGGDLRITYGVYIPVSIPESVTVEVRKGTPTRSTVVGTRTVTLTPAEYTYTSGKGYRQTTQPDNLQRIEVTPTLTQEGYFHICGITQGSTAQADVTQDGYTYSNAFSVRNTIDGLLELNGAFGKITRFNSVEMLQLGDTVDYALTPSDYSECWWDDYSISTIGAVQYQFDEGNSTAFYRFGTGDSVYYMDDNAYLKSLAFVTDKSEIETMIDTYFVAPATEISFIPFELESIGLPFLEAGDRISIDIGTGETIETYILTRTLSGIQVLTDSIDAKGGEVMGDGS